MKYINAMRATFFTALLLFSTESNAKCLSIKNVDQSVKIAPDVLSALSVAKLRDQDFFNTMRIVARYETNGCWAGATGNADGQWLSVGVMQWNFGQGSLQPLLKVFTQKFSSEEHFIKVRDQLMPLYGKDLFNGSCRTIPIGATCKAFLRSQYVGDELKQEFQNEVDNLFNSPAMQQIQIDYYARNLTRVLDDLDRVFQKRQPEAWEVAWAIDLKTQMDRFPTNKSIKQVKLMVAQQQENQRKSSLVGVIKWYEGTVESLITTNIKPDYEYNKVVWRDIVDKGLPSEKVEVIHFTHLVSRTASNIDGKYQADAFQRRATIAFGKGSVHRTRIDLSKELD